MSTQYGKTKAYFNLDELTSPLLKQCPSCNVIAVPRGISDVRATATGEKHCPNCGAVYGRPLTWTTDTKVASIVVTATAGASTITVDGVPLQMIATVLPANASNTNITWTVANGTGNATISATGLLTPGTGASNGTVTVTAGSNDGSVITATKVITLSNQV